MALQAVYCCCSSKEACIGVLIARRLGIAEVDYKESSCGFMGVVHRDLHLYPAETNKINKNIDYLDDIDKAKGDFPTYHIA